MCVTNQTDRLDDRVLTFVQIYTHRPAHRRPGLPYESVLRNRRSAFTYPSAAVPKHTQPVYPASASSAAWLRCSATRLR